MSFREKGFLSKSIMFMWSFQGYRMAKVLAKFGFFSESSELDLKIRRVLACSCSQKFLSARMLGFR